MFFSSARSTSLCFVALLVLSLVACATGQYSKSRPCLQSQSSRVILHRDAISGNFTVVERVKVGQPFSLNNSDIHYRRLEASDLVEGYTAEAISFLRSEVDDAMPGLEVVEDTGSSFRILDESASLSDGGDFFYAWECGCHENLQFGIGVSYCPMDIDTCLRPSRWMNPNFTRTPGCRNLAKAFDFRRNSLFIAIAWFACLIIALFWSNIGSSMMGYMISRCYPSWNEQAVDRMIRRNPERVRVMLGRYILREQRALIQAGLFSDFFRASNQVRPPQSLALKIKVYEKPKSQELSFDENDKTKPAEEVEEDNEISSIDGEEQCTICYCCFEEGDRVGSLACDHLFHSECLKTWLRRQNTCPLCKSEDVAEARYADESGGNEDMASQLPGNEA